MTKKDFKLIASEYYLSVKNGILIDKDDEVFNFLVTVCNVKNKKFDLERFTLACNGLPFKG